jgi:hypothetical protein
MSACVVGLPVERAGPGSAHRREAEDDQQGDFQFVADRFFGHSLAS